MKHYQVEISPKAKTQLRKHLWYLVEKKHSQQPASAVADDFEGVISDLEILAESHRLCDDMDLASEGIRKVFLKKHDYVVLYSVENIVEIHAMYHTLQDYENLFKDSV